MQVTIAFTDTPSWRKACRELVDEHIVGLDADKQCLSIAFDSTQFDLVEDLLGCANIEYDHEEQK